MNALVHEARNMHWQLVRIEINLIGGFRRQ